MFQKLNLEQHSLWDVIYSHHVAFFPVIAQTYRFVALWLVSALDCIPSFGKCEEKCNKEGVSPFAHTEVTRRGWETDREKWILQRLNHNASLSDSVAYLCNCSSHTHTYMHTHTHVFIMSDIMIYILYKLYIFTLSKHIHTQICIVYWCTQFSSNK